MKSRCFNKNCYEYDIYGGRGISICSEWLNDSSSFFKWALDSGYSEGLSIDRINTNGDYCPENCRWVDSLHRQIIQERIFTSHTTAKQTR